MFGERRLEYFPQVIVEKNSGTCLGISSHQLYSYILELGSGGKWICGEALNWDLYRESLRRISLGDAGIGG